MMAFDSHDYEGIDRARWIFLPTRTTRASFPVAVSMNGEILREPMGKVWLNMQTVAPKSPCGVV